MTIDGRDYRDRSHTWLRRLLRRRRRNRRWLIPAAVVVNAFAIAWTVLSVVGLDYIVATLTGWFRFVPWEWWLGLVVVTGGWLLPYARSAMRRWRSRRALRRFADHERALWEGHRRE